MKAYKVKKEDMIGRISKFPIELVQLMIKEQITQGNKADISVFQRSVLADKPRGGFDWDTSKMGLNFWNESVGKEKAIFSVFDIGTTFKFGKTEYTVVAKFKDKEINYYVARSVKSDIDCYKNIFSFNEDGELYSHV